MEGGGSIFNAMLQEFDGAARLLGLDPGIWKILTHPKREMTVAIPVLMDSGESGCSPATACSTASRGGPARAASATPRGQPRRGPGAGRVDDLEVRRRRPPFRRRQGRDHLRPGKLSQRARALTRRYPRDHRHHRARPRRARPRRGHERAGDGLGHGHLLDARTRDATAVVTGKPLLIGGSRGRAKRPAAGSCDPPGGAQDDRPRPREDPRRHPGLGQRRRIGRALQSTTGIDRGHQRHARGACTTGRARRAGGARLDEDAQVPRGLPRGEGIGCEQLSRSPAKS